MKKDLTTSFIPGKTRIKYGGAVVDSKEIRAIQKVLSRNWWTLDEEGLAFERELAIASGVKYSLFANSGSSALLLAIASTNPKRGDEIIIPAVNFPTIVSACLLYGLRPVFVDVDPKTLCIDIEKAKKAISSKTKAIVVVNIAGNTINPSDITFFKKKKIVTILDNCDGFGTTFNGSYVESYYDLAATSFHAAHIITTGEGGALFTNDTQYFKNARSIREWGRADDSDQVKVAKTSGLPKDYPGRYTYITQGFNLKPIELQAAMGRVQLKKLGIIKKTRMHNYKYLLNGIIERNLPIDVSQAQPGIEVSWFAFPMTVRSTSLRGKLRDFLEKRNIETRVIFAGNITRQPAYAKSDYKVSGSLVNSDKVLNDSFFVSTHPSITKPMLEYVLDSLSYFFSKNIN